MTDITDEQMRQMLPKAKNCCIVLLKAEPRRFEPGVEKILWEHGRRNFSLKTDGIMPVVCQVIDGSYLSGVGIFYAGAEEVKKIMDEDPGVKAGVFSYEIHPCRGFIDDIRQG
jgi:hypothetical protein